MDKNERYECKRCGTKYKLYHSENSGNKNENSHQYCSCCLKNDVYSFDNGIDNALMQNINEYVITRKSLNDNLQKEQIIDLAVNLIASVKRWSITNLTQYEYCSAFIKCLLYINNHLSSKLTVNDIAAVAGKSIYHFHRLFKNAMKETPAGYIRRLRLERAVFDILMTNDSLDAIADNVGYQTRNSLIKSLQKVYGISPTQWRISAKSQKDTLNPEQYIEVQPVIKTLNPVTLLYTPVINAYTNKDSFLETWKLILGFTGLDGEPHQGIDYLSIVDDCSIITAHEKIRIYACITGLDHIQPFSVFRLMKHIGGLYAVFPFQGNYGHITKVYEYIYRKWIYEVNYVLRDTTFYEKYIVAPSDKNISNLSIEIYIPIR